MEAGDHYHAVKTNFSKPLAQYQQIIDSGKLPNVTIPARISPTQEEMIMDVDVNVAVTLDQSAAHETMAQSGSNSSNPCPYCDAHKDQLLEHDKEKLAKIPKRTMERLKLLSHTTVGRCPGCGDDIVEHICTCGKCALCVRGRQVKLAKDGDERPKRTWVETDVNGNSVNMSWLQKHLGVVYGRTPVLTIGLHQLIICILHMDLRIMGALFDKLILGNVGQHSKTSKESECAALFTCIKDENGLNIKKVTCPVNKVESNWLSLNHYSMNGPDSHKFKEKKGWVKALDIVMPLESRQGTYT